MRPTLSCLVAVVAVASCSSSPKREQVAPGAITPSKLTTVDSQPLIPRQSFFGLADHTNVLVSPDGATIAWLGLDNGVPNIFTAPVGEPSAAQALTHVTTPGIASFTYARNDQHILYALEAEPTAAPTDEETRRIVVLDTATGVARDVTSGTRSSVIAVSESKRGTVLITSNKRDAQADDVYELDLAKGTLKLVYENRERARDFQASDDQHVLVAERPNPKGREIVVIDLAKKKTRPLLMLQSSRGSLVSVSADGKYAYVKIDNNRATTGLYEVELSTGKQRLVADDPRIDVGDIVLHPTTRAPRLSYFEYDTVSSVLSDSAVAHDLYALKAVCDGRITWSASRNDNVWLVSIADSKSPTRYYLYDRASHEPHYLFSSRDGLAETKLPERRTIVLPGRDGGSMLAYVTLPSSATDDDLPWVTRATPLVVDAGGSSRAGYDARAAWLANRGYVVIQIQSRSANDIADTISWAVTKGVADAEKVAVYGEPQLEPGTVKVVTVPTAQGDMFPVESFLAENLGGRVEPASVVAK